MKVLLLVGLLALAEASGRYDSLLQGFRERQAPTTSEEESDDEKLQTLTNKVKQLEDDVKDLKDKVERVEMLLGNAGQEPGQPDEGDRKEEENSDGGNNEQNPNGASTRVLLQKIKSRIDEIKREQSQMKLSDALTRVLKEKRRK